MKKVTIKDIAKIVGVSHPTVSRSLNDSDLVSDDTKAKIKKVADELGFEFNANARRLKTQKTETIAVILPKNFYHIAAQQFFNVLQKNIIESVEKNSYNVIFQTVENTHTGESNIKKVIGQNQADGIILTMFGLKKEDFEYIKKSKKEYLFLYYKNEFGEKERYFGVDNIYGGYIATKHLMDSGAQQIGTLTAKGEIPEFIERTQGYINAMKENTGKEDINIYETEITFEAAYNWAEKNYNKIKKMDGLFVQTDLMAFGVIQSLKKIGMDIPKDVSIIGYDDIEYCNYFVPSLTTVHQPLEEVVKKACQNLINRIEGRKIKNQKRVFKPYLTKRDSVNIK
ncbi:MAG: LacI family DNA-binding transcriptional regulator [Fusobacteriota bacterium]